MKPSPCMGCCAAITINYWNTVAQRSYQLEELYYM